MHDQPTAQWPISQVPTRDGIPRTTPISGYATAAFIFALIGPYTLGLLSLVAVACAHYATSDTKHGYRGGHFLTVAAMIIGYTTIGLFIILGSLVALGWLAL